MNALKAEKLFILMKKHGVSHFKTLELEIRMKDAEAEGPGGNKPSIESLAAKPSASVPDPQAIPPVEVAIPHHVNEVANLLKLNDFDLVDKLFPDYSQIPPIPEGR
jgi:hypothetical protein